MQSSESNETERARERVGENASFPYDRMTVERLQQTFHQARWNDERKAWFVPGRTAARRIDRWLAKEAANGDTHADGKGRDGYAFDPIESKYLEATGTGFYIRTPSPRPLSKSCVKFPGRVGMAIYALAGAFPII